MPYLEINHNTGAVNVTKVNFEGFVTHEVTIGNSKSRTEAVALAHRLGWQTVPPEAQTPDWWVSGDFECVGLEPTPVWVSFVASEKPDNALELAQEHGIPATEICATEVLPDEGKVRVCFTVETPRQWTWAESPDYNALTEGDIELPL